MPKKTATYHGQEPSAIAHCCDHNCQVAGHIASIDRKLGHYRDGVLTLERFAPHCNSAQTELLRNLLDLSLGTPLSAAHCRVLARTDLALSEHHDLEELMVICLKAHMHVESVESVWRSWTDQVLLETSSELWSLALTHFPGARRKLLILMERRIPEHKPKDLSSYYALAKYMLEKDKKEDCRKWLQIIIDQGSTCQATKNALLILAQLEAENGNHQTAYEMVLRAFHMDEKLREKALKDHDHLLATRSKLLKRLKED